MKKIKWNNGWKFWNYKETSDLDWSIPECAVDVTVPHDAMIEKAPEKDSLNGAAAGYRRSGIYAYSKTFFVPEEKQDRTLLLHFEGVYMNAFIYVNGEFASKNPNGYASFEVDLVPFLKYGQENEIRVVVRTGEMPTSRWYPGTGIYRDVWLLEGGLVFLEPESIQVRTLEADTGYALAEVSAKVANLDHRTHDVAFCLVIQAPGGENVAEEKTPLCLAPGESRTVRRRIAVETPELWDAENPALYAFKGSLTGKQGEVLDESEGTFGLRTVSADGRRGLRINGRTVKLRGACIHHDSGLLGTATYEEAQFRQIKKLKEAGFNAVRMSHHPMAPAMLRACDEIGMYVMDELTDMWNRPKSDCDYGSFFSEWWKRDVRSMTRKDYNHPSVILYSIGNEIPEISSEQGARLCGDLSEEIRKYDDTRLILASVNGFFAAGMRLSEIREDMERKRNASQTEQTGELDASKAEGDINDFMTAWEGHTDEGVNHRVITECLERTCGMLDVAGYNYMTARYEPDSRRYPNRVIVGSETYPGEIARNWGLVKKLPAVIGDFTWTGWDYIGETGIGIPAYKAGEGGFGAAFPSQLAYCGDIDLTGRRRPMSYYREIVFGLRKAPYLAVQDPAGRGKKVSLTPWILSDADTSWTWSGYEGQTVTVEVYSAGDEAELFCNGRSIGRKTAGERSRFRVLFDLPYEPGVLTAVSYEDGKEIGRYELHTAGEAEKLLLKEEPLFAPADRDEGIRYIDVSLADENGNTADNDFRTLFLETEGETEWSAFGSGDPKPVYNYNESRTKAFHGHALIIVKKKEKEAKVRLTVRSEDGLSGAIII